MEANPRSRRRVYVALVVAGVALVAWWIWSSVRKSELETALREILDPAISADYEAMHASGSIDLREGLPAAALRAFFVQATARYGRLEGLESITGTRTGEVYGRDGWNHLGGLHVVLAFERGSVKARFDFTTPKSNGGDWRLTAIWIDGVGEIHPFSRPR